MSIGPLQMREKIPPAHWTSADIISPPVEDRRIAQRVKAPFQADISAVVNDRVDKTFHVTVEDLSTTGLRISHSDRLKPGAKYLLEIPRPGQPPLGAFFTVVRCDESEGGGSFSVELQPQDVLDMTSRAAVRRYVPPEKTSSGLLGLVIIAVLAAGATSYFLFFL